MLTNKEVKGVGKLDCYRKRRATTILDINYVDFLQFQRYFTPQAELEEAFIYIIHKPIDFSIDFSCRLRSYGHWLETSKSANRNLVPSPNTKNHLLSLFELADRK